LSLVNLPLDFKSKITPIVARETQIVEASVFSKREDIRLSSTNCAITETGTIVIESEQAANSEINHSNLFSEKIAKNFKSGVPWTLLGII
jgi:hypothetical protein